MLPERSLFCPSTRDYKGIVLPVFLALVGRGVWILLGSEQFGSMMASKRQQSGDGTLARKRVDLEEMLKNLHLKDRDLNVVFLPKDDFEAWKEETSWLALVKVHKTHEEILHIFFNSTKHFLITQTFFYIV